MPQLVCLASALQALSQNPVQPVPTLQHKSELVNAHAERCIICVAACICTQRIAAALLETHVKHANPPCHPHQLHTHELQHPSHAAALSSSHAKPKTHVTHMPLLACSSPHLTPAGAGKTQSPVAQQTARWLQAAAPSPLMLLAQWPKSTTATCSASHQ
jgi:hypothetical protein